jgi:hypothetical protein
MKIIGEKKISTVEVYEFQLEIEGLVQSFRLTVTDKYKFGLVRFGEHSHQSMDHRLFNNAFEWMRERVSSFQSTAHSPQSMADSPNK